ncbi:Permease of the drug/metabolite transporter (DMT) superfamily [Aquamicrobium aerolatum DSM 21857]|uniref:Permease of the drug/metabolite transporter (DMT) superfamily n=2 Tax=Aerobium TaxID=3143707 RepID=A0A1I3QBE2_9HYPH|nr:Permease of the drug/metabolite transporter (DMT) superfamily [Aquamicrobium aerolatum DSM 21857]
MRPPRTRAPTQNRLWINHYILLAKTFGITANRPKPRAQDVMTISTRFIPPLFVVLWATGFIGARYAMPRAEPFSFLAVRCLITLILLLLIALILRSKRLPPAKAAHAAFAGALIHGIYLSGVFWAIKNGMPAGLSALIIGLQPLITTLIAGWALGERVQPRHWAGLGIGFVGILIVLAPKIGDALGGVTAATFAACVGSAVAISAGTVWQKRFVGSADLVTVTVWQYVGALALTLIGSLALETREFTLNGEIVFAMAWLVLVLSIGAIFLLMMMIREGEMSKVSSLFYLVPAVTTVIAWALFNETLSLVQIAGMVVTTVGVGMATRR